jgi:glycerol uptake facilitator-like aquaporin
MTAETFASIIGTALLAYTCCGVVFMIAFLLKGVNKVDGTAHGSTWGFKLMINPGVIALWPVLLKKWRKT